MDLGVTNVDRREFLRVAAGATIHESAYVDEGAVIGQGTKIWHFSHILPRTTVERSREYRFDETQALGAAAEDELARRELRREVLQALLRSLESLGG